MKPKTFNKKLELNKQTIYDLNNGQMRNAQGGNIKTTTTAIPCVYSCWGSCRVTICDNTCVSCGSCTDCNSDCSGACC